MIYILVGSMVFLVLFLFFLILYLVRLKKERYEKLFQINYFVRRFKLDKKKINYKYFFLILSIINALIISFVGVFTIYIDIKFSFNLMIEFFLAFLLMLGLIFSLYDIYGRLISRKWGK